MSLDASAIEKIQTTTPTTHSIEKIQNHKTVVALPDNYKLHDIEHLLPQPLQFKGNFTTSHLKSFADYVLSHQQQTTACFIQPETLTAATVFNVGTAEQPEHRFHIAEVRLEKTAPFKEALKAKDKSHDQMSLAFFMSDFAHYIQPIDEKGNPIDLKDAIRAIRNLTIDENSATGSAVGQFSAKKSVLESIALKAEGAMPHIIQFKCRPYKELSEYIFPLRIALGEAGGRFRFTLEIINSEQIDEEIAEEFQSTLSDILPQELKILIGQFS